MRILIIDDVITQAKVNQSRLRAAGHDVLGIALSGEAGIAQCEALKPDLLILDVQLGDWSGALLARHLWDEDIRPHIVFITNMAQDFITGLCREIGARLVVKPYSPDYLVEQVAKFSHGDDIPSP